MDSFELNKIIGALLGVVFVIFSVSLISDAIFSSPEPETPGYAIEATEGAGAGAGGGEANKDEVEDIKPMLASADPEQGKAIFKRCQACHTDDQSGANKIGPNLWGVVDRPIASHEGFSYSSALKEFSQGGQENWTYDHLNHFIAGPKKLVPGTAMSFAGLPKAEDRANVIAYLRTQADSPAPLPEPEAEGAEDAEGGAAAAEGEKAGEEQGQDAQPAEDQGKGGEAAPAEGTEQAPAAGETEQGEKAGDSGRTGQEAGPQTDGQAGSGGTDAAPQRQDEGAADDQ